MFMHTNDVSEMKKCLIYLSYQPLVEEILKEVEMVKKTEPSATLFRIVSGYESVYDNTLYYLEYYRNLNEKEIEQEKQALENRVFQFKKEQKALQDLGLI